MPPTMADGDSRWLCECRESEIVLTWSRSKWVIITRFLIREWVHRVHILLLFHLILSRTRRHPFPLSFILLLFPFLSEWKYVRLWFLFYFIIKYVLFLKVSSCQALGYCSSLSTLGVQSLLLSKEKQTSPISSSHNYLDQVCPFNFALF